MKVYDDMKEEIKNLKTLTVHWRSNIFIKQFCIFWKCRNPTVVKTKSGRIILLSNCADCVSKKSRFIKEQQASELLSSLGIKTRLSKIPLEGLFLF